MKVIVFGATGVIGKAVVSQALSLNHDVYSFSRQNTILELINHSRLNNISGDVFNQQDVQEATVGMDAVIIVLGSGKDRHSIVRSEGTKNIIKAMKKTGVKRLVCQTTLGAGNSQGNLNFFWKYIMFGCFLKGVFQDHELQEKYVQNSTLDWTIVRPAAFVNTDKKASYQHGFSSEEKSITLKISTADVADFILKQLYSDQYLFKMAGVSY